MNKKWAITGLILVVLAIALGAFGAHGLKSKTDDETILAEFDTATKYQFFQGLGFLIIPFLLKEFQLSGKWVFNLLLVGTIFFSGSIYGLTCAKLNHVDGLLKVFGPITPLGGLCMISAWFLLLIQVVRYKKQ
jgi:uncharacterized membrane protein YgdD (TMEM256/DUF423 family)